MVDVGTWEALSEEERREFRELSPVWQQVLADAGIVDGTELLVGWDVILRDGAWGFTRHGSPLAKPWASSRAVVNALRADAIQNLNR
jgi:hypothetical protein